MALDNPNQFREQVSLLHYLERERVEWLGAMMIDPELASTHRAQIDATLDAMIAMKIYEIDHNKKARNGTPI